MLPREAYQKTVWLKQTAFLGFQNNPVKDGRALEVAGELEIDLTTLLYNDKESDCIRHQLFHRIL